MLCNFEIDSLEERFTRELKIASEEGVLLITISFEELLEAMESIVSTDFLKRCTTDFRAYHDKSGLLPAYMKLLTEVNYA